MTRPEILNAISELKNYSTNRNWKYRRNYRYYNYTKAASLDNIKAPTPVGVDGWDNMGEADTTRTPQLNIVASVIDTLTSKIAQSKVRPFFNTINGTFKDIQAVKQAQQFFDLMFDKLNVFKTTSEAFRDSCIFDTGVLYIDPININIVRALPSQVYTRPSEETYGKVTRVYYEQKDFPVTLLPQFVLEKFKRKMDYVDFGVYYDTYNKVVAYTANGSIVTIEEWNSDVVPFVFLHYKSPILGNTSVSVADMLYTVQDEIDVLMTKIKDASQLNPALTFFLPEGSGLKASKFNNRVGNVVTYKPVPGNSGSPVSSSAPAFIDGQYQVLLDSLIEKAYSMVGISQLSAQSKKPTGLNSGVALDTMENVESDRFETQLNSYIRAFTDITRIAIKVLPAEENILPEVATRCSIKWKDIVKESDNFAIQYSAADSLSKDPSVKLQQLQQLSMAGVIPTARIAQFMQIPDLEMGYSLTNNAIDAVMVVIKDCLEKDNFDVPSYIPFPLLKEEIINTQLALRAGNKEKNYEDINKLAKLYEIVEDQETEWSAPEVPQEQQYTEEGMPIQQNVLTTEAETQRKGDWDTQGTMNRV